MQNMVFTVDTGMLYTLLSLLHVATCLFYLQCLNFLDWKAISRIGAQGASHTQWKSAESSNGTERSQGRDAEVFPTWALRVVWYQLAIKTGEDAAQERARSSFLSKLAEAWENADLQLGPTDWHMSFLGIHWLLNSKCRLLRAFASLKNDSPRCLLQPPSQMSCQSIAFWLIDSTRSWQPSWYCRPKAYEKPCTKHKKQKNSARRYIKLRFTSFHHFPQEIVAYWYSLPRTNIAPENMPPQKENRLPTVNLEELC